MEGNKKLGTSKRGRKVQNKEQIIAERNTFPKADVTEIESVVKELYHPKIKCMICLESILTKKEIRLDLQERYLGKSTQEETNKIINKICKSFKSFVTKRSMSIAKLKFYAKTFVDSALTELEGALHEAYVDEDIKSYLWFNEEEREEIKNTIVCMYLESWLTGCTELRHTIQSFSKHPYCFRSEIDAQKKNSKTEGLCYNAFEMIWGTNKPEGMTRNLRDAYLKYKEQRICRFEQAKKESDLRNNLPAKFKKRDKYHDRGITLDIHTLCCLDLIANKSYSILDEIDYWNKNEGTTISKDNVRWAIIDYCNFLDSLEQMYADGAEKNNYGIKRRKYVEACIVIGQIENATCIQLRLELANLYRKNDDVWDEKAFEMAGELWGRSSNNYFRTIFPCYYRQTPGKGKAYSYQEPSFEILNYSKWFDLINEPKNSEKGYLISIKQMFKRAIIGDALTLLITFCKPREQRNWEESDFADAATFFHDSYPIVKNYSSALHGVRELLSSEETCEEFISLFFSIDPGKFTA